MLVKTILEIKFDKNFFLKKTEKKFARKECDYFNEVGRKIISIVFCFGCSTQNKALNMLKLVSEIYFSYKEFMVSKELITALMLRRFRPLLPEKLYKNVNIGVIHFLWSLITYLPYICPI